MSDKKYDVVIYKLSDNTIHALPGDGMSLLIHGNCLEEMPRLKRGSVDLILCDLPYGKTTCKWDRPLPLFDLWHDYELLLKKTGVVALFSSEPFGSELRLSKKDWFRYDWIWEKGNATGHLNAKRRPMLAHETISIFSPGISPYNPIKTQGHARKACKRKAGKSIYGDHGACSYDSTERYPRSVLKFSSSKQRGALHPTEKPIPLLEYLIQTYTFPGATVLDNCMGCGSTGVACKNTGRQFIGIEKDEKFFELASARLNPR